MDDKRAFRTIKGTDGLSTHLSANNISANEVTIIRNEDTGFMVFSSPAAMFAYIDSIDDPHCHEVVPQGRQKLRFDIDATYDDLCAVDMISINTDADMPAITSNNVVFDNVTAVIMDRIYDLYLITYGNDPEIAICESVDPDNLKYSRHLIIVGTCVSTSIQAREFTRQLVQMIPPQYRRFLDVGVNKTLQMFRIVGCSKKGDNRVKRITTAHSREDTLLANTRGCKELKNIAANDDLLPQPTSPHVDEVLRIAKAAGIAEHHKFRYCRDNLYLFDRISETYCEFCKRSHTNDNTVVLAIAPGTDAMLVYERCRKSDGSKLIGEFTADIAPEVRRSRVERLISATPPPDDDFKGDTVEVYDEPKLRDFKLCDTLVVHAMMKMGKTKKLKEYIAAHFPHDALDPPVIRFISFRQTFAGNIKENFANFTLYSDEKNQILAHPRLIIQVESLHRLEIEGTPPDLLILDECESIFEQFDSGLMRRFSVVVAKFIYLLQHSKHVVCMDANITMRTENVLRNIRAKPVHYHRNTYQNATADTVKITTSRDEWMSYLDERIVANNKIAIPCSSLEVANALHSMLTTRHNDRKINIYSSETSIAEKREHFARVNEFWTQYDVIIYTPTVSAGVSFEEKHFDYVFGYFTDQSCNDLTCVQMMGRIRDISTRETCLCIIAGSASHPTSIREIREQFYQRRQALFADYNGIDAAYDAYGDITYHTTPYFHIWVENVRARNLSKNQFAARLISIIKSTGATVVPLEYVGTLAGEYGEHKTLTKHQRSAAIANAADVDEMTANDIVDRMSRQKIVPVDEVNQYKKYHLRDLYKFYHEMTPAFVGTYLSPTARLRFRNISAIGECTDADLHRIQSQERALYRNTFDADEPLRDIRHRYMYNKHRFAVELLRMCEFNNITTAASVGVNGMAKDLIEDDAKDLLYGAAVEFEIKKPRAPADKNDLARAIILMTDKVLTSMYGVRLAAERGEPNIFWLRPNELFSRDPACKNMPIIVSHATQCEELTEYPDEPAEIEEYVDLVEFDEYGD